MAPATLRIDTNVSDGLSRSALESPRSKESISAVVRSAKSFGRLRSASLASSSSSVSSSASASVSPSRVRSHAMNSAIHLPQTSSSSTNSVKYAWSSHGHSSGEEDEGPSDYVLAMHDFTPDPENDTCLAFRARQVIHVINRHNSGWWDGEVDGRRGWFPSNYVTSDVGLLTDEELPDIPVRVFSFPLVGTLTHVSTAIATFQGQQSWPYLFFCLSHVLD